MSVPPAAHPRQVQGRHDELFAEYSAAQARLEEVEEYGRRIAEETAKLNAMENDENKECVEPCVCVCVCVCLCVSGGLVDGWLCV